MRNHLIDIVMDQILEDLREGDHTAIEELLTYVPEVNLRAFLSEEKQFQLYEMESPR